MASVVTYQRPFFLPPTIHWAVESGRLDEVRKVIAAERGKGYPAAVCLASRDQLLGATPLHVAAETGNIEMIEFLLSHGMDINCHDDTNTTPLHLAAWGSHLEAVRLLAKRGALVTLQDASGDQPLHWAATKGHTAVAELLLELGATQEAANSDGWTALHRAAYNGRTATCQLLLSRGASVQALTARGDTPLHLACRNNHLPVVQLLLEWKARPRFANCTGELPYNLCIEEGARSLLLAADPQAAQPAPARRAAGSAVPAAIAVGTGARGAAAEPQPQSQFSYGGSLRSTASFAAPSARSSASQLTLPMAAVSTSNSTLQLSTSLALAGGLTPVERSLPGAPTASAAAASASSLGSARPSGSQLQLPSDTAAIKHAMSTLESFVAASQGQPQRMPSTTALAWETGSAAGAAIGGDTSTSGPGTSRTSASQRTIRVSGALRIDADGFPSELADGHE